MQLTLLIIDDAPKDRTLFKHYVRKSGYDITILEAENAKEGIEAVRKSHDIDCMFFDYMMPDMDGISMLKKIYNSDLDLAPFPAVMLTGQGSEAVAIDAIRYGAQDYLIKDNISTDTLHIAIAKAKKFFQLQQDYNSIKGTTSNKHLRQKTA